MKKTSNKNIILSIAVACALIVGSILSTKVDAQGLGGLGKQIGGAINAVNTQNQVSQKIPGLDLHYEFAGKMTVTDICCNGLVYNIQKGDAVGGGATGSFIFPWQNMIPVYQLGIGLYQYWQPMTGKTVAGDATKSGQCIIIASECEAQYDVDYTTWKMGTILR